MSEKFQSITQSPEETQAWAETLLQKFPGFRVIFLEGELGAGKTTLVKGLAKSFGTDPKQVKSPTFSFCEDHGDWVHYDLYRLTELDELTEAQILEQFEDGKTLVIEWPQVLGERLSMPILRLKLSHHPKGRSIEALQD